MNWFWEKGQTESLKKLEDKENVMELSDEDAQKIVAVGRYDDFQSNHINSGARIQGIKEIIEKIHLQ